MYCSKNCQADIFSYLAAPGVNKIHRKKKTRQTLKCKETLSLMCDEFHTWSDKFLRKSSIMYVDIFEVILSNPKKRKRENNVGGAYITCLFQYWAF